MKKNYFLFLFVSVSLLVAPLFMTATPPDTIKKTTNMPGLLTSLGDLANWLFSLLIAVGVIAIVISGYMFVTSAGDPQKTTTARMMAIYALVGILVAALAWALVHWVRDIV